MKPITLNPGDQIIAVVPERAEGPGWSNDVVWVYIKTLRGTLRTESIQPEEQSDELRTLFSIGAEVCRELKAAALKQMGWKRLKVKVTNENH